MPITTPAAYAESDGDLDHFAHVLDHLFIPALTDLGYHTLLPSVEGSEFIHAEIIKNLEQADLVLCDLSSLNPNVFFELGIRTALDRPIVLVRDKLTPQIPFDLNVINVLMYDGSLKPWTLKKEIPRLVDHIKASAKKGSGTGNAMWRYFGITKPASPAAIEGDPLNAKVDLMVDEIARLQRQVSNRPFSVRDTGIAFSSESGRYLTTAQKDQFKAWVIEEARKYDIVIRASYAPDDVLEIVSVVPIPENLQNDIAITAARIRTTVNFTVTPLQDEPDRTVRDELGRPLQDELGRPVRRR